MKKLLVGLALLTSVSSFGEVRKATSSEFKKMHKQEVVNFEKMISILRKSPQAEVTEREFGTNDIETNIKIVTEGERPDTGESCFVTIEKEKVFYEKYEMIEKGSFYGTDWDIVIFDDINIKLEYGVTIQNRDKSELGGKSNHNKYRSLRKGGVKIIKSAVTPHWFSNRTISEVTYQKNGKMLVEVEAIPELGGGSEMYPAIKAGKASCLVNIK